MKRLVDKTTIRYMEFGVLNALFCTAIMYLLYNLTSLESWVCALVNHGLGGVISYVFNRNYVFRARKRSLRTPVLFALNLAVCYVIAYSIALPGIEVWMRRWPETAQDNVAMGLGVLIFVVLNYFGQRYFVFRGFDRKD